MASVSGLAIFFFLVCLYICICYYQALFIELRKKFIAWKVVYLDGEFNLGGYYFKQARFKETELAFVEQFKVSPRFFIFTNTLLTVNQLIRCSFNLKVTLKDGRIFYFPGELDRLTLGEVDQGDGLKTFLEERIRANNGT